MDNDDVKPNAFHTPSSWFVLKYKIEVINGVEFIVAESKKNQRADEEWWYDPLEKKEKLEKRPKNPENHHSSPHVDLANLDTTDKRSLLEFVNRWGLLGLWKVKKYRELHWISHDTNSQGYSELFRHKNKRRRLRFQEPVSAIQKAAHDYQQILKSINSDKICYLAELEFEEMLKGCHFGSMRVNNSSSSRKIGIKFDSLLHAIYLRTAFDLNEGDLKSCLRFYCKRYFLNTKRPNNQFCSITCSKAHRGYERRKRKLIDTLALEHSSIDPKWIQSEVTKLIESGIKGEKKLTKAITEIINSKPKE